MHFPSFPIAPSEVRYIRFGPGNRWAEQAITAGEVVFGDPHIPHAISHSEDWAAVEQFWRDRGKTKKAKDFTRELRDFCTLGADCHWITFHRGRLWWAFAEPVIEFREGGEAVRVRKTIGPWRDTDANGVALRQAGLSSFLTKVAAYQQTVCRVSAKDYLLRRINALTDPDVENALRLEAELVDVTARLIQRLDWREFEVLADRLAEAVGWRRTTLVGGPQARFDFTATIPALDVTGYFQVKASAGQAQLDDFVRSIDEAGDRDRKIFICHQPKGPLTADAQPGVEVWAGIEIARRAVRAGLTPWIIERSK